MQTVEATRQLEQQKQDRVRRSFGGSNMRKFDRAKIVANIQAAVRNSVPLIPLPKRRVHSHALTTVSPNFNFSTDEEWADKVREAQLRFDAQKRAAALAALAAVEPLDLSAKEAVH